MSRIKYYDNISQSWKYADKVIGGSGAKIEDDKISNTTTWSSSKIDKENKTLGVKPILEGKLIQFNDGSKYPLENYEIIGENEETMLNDAVIKEILNTSYNLVPFPYLTGNTTIHRVNFTLNEENRYLYLSGNADVPEISTNICDFSIANLPRDTKLTLQAGTGFAGGYCYLDIMCDDDILVTRKIDGAKYFVNIDLADYPTANRLYLYFKKTADDTRATNCEIRPSLWIGTYYYDTMPKYTNNDGNIYQLSAPVSLSKWDKIYKKDGVWGYTNHEQEIIFKGDVTKLNVRYFPAVLYYQTSFGYPKMYGRNNIINNKGFQYIDGQSASGQDRWSAIGMSANEFNNIYNLGMTKDNALQVFNDWCLEQYNAGTPFKLKYYSDDTTDSFIPLPQEDQVLLNKITAFYPETTICSGGNDKAQYVADTEQWVLNKINEVSNAVVVNG